MNDFTFVHGLLISAYTYTPEEQKSCAELPRRINASTRLADSGFHIRMGNELECVARGFDTFGVSS